ATAPHRAHWRARGYRRHGRLRAHAARPAAAGLAHRHGRRVHQDDLTHSPTFGLIGDAGRVTRGGLRRDTRRQTRAREPGQQTLAPPWAAENDAYEVRGKSVRCGKRDRSSTRLPDTSA